MKQLINFQRIHNPVIYILICINYTDTQNHTAYISIQKKILDLQE